MWQNWKFILPVSYSVMLNTCLESLNFAKSIQKDFQKKWKAGSFSQGLSTVQVVFKVRTETELMEHLKRLKRETLVLAVPAEGSV